MMPIVLFLKTTWDFLKNFLRKSNQNLQQVVNLLWWLTEGSVMSQKQIVIGVDVVGSPVKTEKNKFFYKKINLNGVFVSTNTRNNFAFTLDNDIIQILSIYKENLLIYVVESNKISILVFD